MALMYFDAHSHVTFGDYGQDLPEVLGRMREQGVGTITVGVDLKTSAQAVEASDRYEDFYATIGLHPNDTPDEQFDEGAFAALVAHPKVVGIGECGLDYHWLPSTGDVEQEKQRQKGEFEKQIAFAKKYDKPLMLHCRPSKGTMDAYLDVLELLAERPLPTIPGNVHFFVGSVDVARRFYDLGFTTSFTGVLTFTRDYDEVVRAAPADMILTETDAPYAAPVPFRGRRNEPSYVRYVVAAIARIRGVEEEVVRTQILENARRVFRVPSP